MTKTARPYKGPRLQTIFEVARILATRHSLDDMLPNFLASLVATFPSADAAAVLLYDAGLGCLQVTASHGFEPDGLAGLRLAPGEAICGAVFQNGLAARHSGSANVVAAMSTLTPANRLAFEQATRGAAHPLSALAVPLTAGQTRLGVLLVEQFRNRGPFGQADLDFLRHVADLIALAIENDRLREQLQSERSLNEGNRLKAELISTLAHEMRTPLTSIKGYSTALLMEEATFAPRTQREFLQIIDEETEVLQDLIRDLLESSVIDAGLLKLEPQPVRLSRLVADVVADAARRNPRCRFVVDLPATLPLVDADPRRIEQVLRNLLDNAVKYSPESSVIVVRGEIRGGEATLSVADQGVGIAPADLNRLFEKFFRVKTGLGRHVVGSGLGLPIARTIVESHGGRIWAESQVGRGSTFYFTLPLHSASDRDGESEDMP
jgi:signal transduction histidine kinase